MFLLNPHIASGEYPYYALFNGDVLSSGGLSGAADDNKFTVSCWVYPQYDVGTQEILNIGDRFVLTLQYSASYNKYAPSFTLKDASGASVLNAGSSIETASYGYLFNTGASNHFIFSYDGDADVAWFAVNRSSHDLDNIANSSDIDFTATSVTVGEGLKSGIQHLWVAPGVYVADTEIDKFIDSNSDPVSLGYSGDVPTGTSPILYLSGEPAGFHYNRGTGGDFTVTGELSKGTAL